MSKKKVKESAVSAKKPSESLKELIVRQSKNQCVLEDTIDELKNTLKSSYDKSCKMERDCRNLLTQVSSALKKYDSHLIACKNSLKKQEEYLKKNNQLHQNVDESLGNMLLAINQNSFLKAWYPKQHGYEEMKVVGKHPAKMQVAESK